MENNNHLKKSEIIILSILAVISLIVRDTYIGKFCAGFVVGYVVTHIIAVLIRGTFKK